MSRILVSYFLCLTCISVHAQQIYKGRVLNNKKEPVSDLKIEAHSLYARTDVNGEFEFDFSDKNIDGSILLEFKLMENQLLNGTVNQQWITEITGSSKPEVFFVQDIESSQQYILKANLDNIEKKLEKIQKTGTQSIDNWKNFGKHLEERKINFQIETSVVLSFPQYEIQCYEAQTLFNQGNIAKCIAILESQNLSINQPKNNSRYGTSGQPEYRNDSIINSIIDCRLLLADAYSKNSQPAKAIANYKLVYKYNESNWRAGYSLANLLAQEGELLESIDVYGTLPNRDSVQMANSEMGMARCYLKLGLLDSVAWHVKIAEKYMKQISLKGSVQNNLQISESYRLLANLFLNIQENELSLDYHLRALEILQPYIKSKYDISLLVNCIKINIEVAKIYASLDQPDDAILYIESSVDQVARLLPSHSLEHKLLLIEALLVRSILHANVFDFDKAELDLSRAKKSLDYSEILSIEGVSRLYLKIKVFESLLPRIKKLHANAKKLVGHYKLLIPTYKFVMPSMKNYKNHSHINAEIFTVLGEITMAEGDFELADNLFSESKSIYDSLEIHSIHNYDSDKIDLLQNLLELSDKTRDINKFEEYFSEARVFLERWANSQLPEVTNSQIRYLCKSLAQTEYAKSRPLMAVDYLRLGFLASKMDESITDQHAGNQIRLLNKIAFLSDRICEIFPDEDLITSVRQLFDDSNVYLNHLENALPELFEYHKGLLHPYHISFVQDTVFYERSVDEDESLARACEYGYVDLIEQALERGADIEYLSQKKMTPIQIACYRGNYEAYNFLLEKGSNLEVETDYNESLLHLASVFGDTLIMRDLIHRGLSVNDKSKAIWVINKEKDQLIQYTTRKVTPLMIASGSGSLEAVEMLVNKGAKVNVFTNTGKSPLYFSLQHENESIPLFLLRNKAKAYYGYSDMASLQEMHEVVKVLKDRWIPPPY